MNRHFSKDLLCCILECNFCSIISSLRVFVIAPRCWIRSTTCIICDCCFSIPNCFQRIGLLIFFNILCQLRRIIYRTNNLICLFLYTNRCRNRHCCTQNICCTINCNNSRLVIFCFVYRLPSYRE